MASAAPGLAQWRCRQHADRPGIGLCARCRATLCEECATRLDGILHCRQCLTRAARGARSGRWRSLSALAPACALGLLTWLALGYGFYGLVALAALGAEWARR